IRIFYTYIKFHMNHEMTVTRVYSFFSVASSNFYTFLFFQFTFSTQKNNKLYTRRTFQILKTGYVLIMNSLQKAGRSGSGLGSCYSRNIIQTKKGLWKEKKAVMCLKEEMEYGML